MEQNEIIATPSTSQNTTASSASASSSDEIVDKGLVFFHKNGKRMVRCEFCVKYPNIVNQYVNKKPPPMTTESGTRFLTDVVASHLQSSYHQECAKLYCESFVVAPTTKPPLVVALANQNSKFYLHVCKLMIQIFADGKRLSTSAFSWPGRYVAHESSSLFTLDSPSVVCNDINLQYVNPTSHLMLMQAIVQSDTAVLKKTIDNSLALNLQIDGSIDRTQIDKIYVMARIIEQNGTEKQLLLGIGEQTKRKAEGLMEAVRTALDSIIKDDTFLTKIFSKISSVCTDGTNVNTGERNSLWTLLEAEIRKHDSKNPLIKVWCGAHRSELAWKDTCKTITQVSKMFSVLYSMSSYFHQSAIRTSELKEIAKVNSLELLKLSKIFEIRWAEFTFSLVKATLVSWKSLILYFEATKDSSSNGFKKFLTNKSNCSESAGHKIVVSYFVPMRLSLNIIKCKLNACLLFVLVYSSISIDFMT